MCIRNNTKRRQQHNNNYRQQQEYFNILLIAAIWYICKQLYSAMQIHPINTPVNTCKVSRLQSNALGWGSRLLINLL